MNSLVLPLQRMMLMMCILSLMWITGSPESVIHPELECFGHAFVIQVIFSFWTYSRAYSITNDRAGIGLCCHICKSLVYKCQNRANSESVFVRASTTALDISQMRKLVLVCLYFLMLVLHGVFFILLCANSAPQECCGNFYCSWNIFVLAWGIAIVSNLRQAC